MWLPLGILNLVNTKNLVLNSNCGHCGLYIFFTKNIHTWFITKRGYITVSSVVAQFYPPKKMLTGASLMIIHQKNFRRYATSRGQMALKNILIADTVLAEAGT